MKTRIAFPSIAALVSLLGTAACGVTVSDVFTPTDSGTPSDGGATEDVAPPEFPDAAVTDVGAPVSKGFFLLATNTPASPAADGSNWLGVQRFDFDDDYAPPVAGVGMPKSTQAPFAIRDPAALTFRWASAEVFVTNRGGNLAGNSSISKFAYDAKTQTFGPGSVVVSGYSGLHQMTFNRTQDEMFVGTNNEGMRRFKLTNNAWVEQPQPVGAPHWIRGVAVSPDGTRLYASTAGSVIRQWDLTTNQELTAVTVPDNQALLHFMTLCGPPMGNMTTGCSPARLYVGDAKSNGTQSVYSFEIDSNDDLVNRKTVTAAPSFSVALSPDGKELFSGQSGADKIQRFTPSGSSWVSQSSITAASNIGTILIFPKNAVPVLPN